MSEATIEYSILEKFEGQEKIQEDAFNGLKAEASKAADAPNFKGYCWHLEDEYLEKKYAGRTTVSDTDSTPVRKRNGEWRRRALLPTSYTSAKSILVRALHMGYALDQGKSALSALVSKRGASVVLTPKQRALKLLMEARTAIHEIGTSAVLAANAINVARKELIDLPD